MIAFRAGEAAWSDIERRETGGFGAFADGGDGFFVELRIFHDSARADIFSA